MCCDPDSKSKKHTRRQCSKYHAPNALVQPPEERTLPDGARGFIDEEAAVVGRLDARLEGVERVDEEVDCECCERAGLFVIMFSLCCNGHVWCVETYDPDICAGIAGHLDGCLRMDAASAGTLDLVYSCNGRLYAF